MTGSTREPGRPRLPRYRTAQARARIAYWDIGEGPSVILLHTFPDHAVGMLPLARDVAERGFRVVVPALPGYWPSGKVMDGDYSIAAVASDILCLADRLGLKTPHLIGHGWGGEIAYHLAVHAPGRIASAVVLSVPHPAGLARRHQTFQGLQSAAYAYFLAYSPGARETAAQRDWLTAAIAWASPGMHRTDWPTILSLIARQSEIDTACGYYRCDLDTKSQPEPVLVRTTVIHGADTPALPPFLYEDLEEWFPAGLTHHLLEGAGQWPHLEAPELVLDMIWEHLTDD